MRKRRFRKNAFINKLSLVFTVGICINSLGVLSGQTQDTATLDVTMQTGSGTTNRSGVAFNPDKQLYYSVNAGSSSYPIETYDINGNVLSSTNQSFDYRGLWWNPNTNQLEGNGYNNLGIWAQALNGTNGHALNSGSLVIAGVSGPDNQSCADYDYMNDEILYYHNGKIYSFSRAAHTVINTVTITGLPVGLGNINSTSLVYIGISGLEIGIYDYVTKSLYLINKSTGSYVASCYIPVTSSSHNRFRMAFANGRFFLFDQATRIWSGYLISNIATDTSLSLVSDSSWSLSTVTTTATANSYPWPGVMSTPATPTFTLAVDVNQPYPWEHLYTVDGSQVITAQSGVTYYRNTFDLVDPAGIEARFRMFVDDNMEIFINGHWIALEDDMGQHNWRTVNHDLLFNGDGTSTNGNAGGDAFDYVTGADMDTVFKAGTNEIILAIRNRTSKPDLGGFSFRMDLDKGAVKKAEAVTRSNSAVTADNKLIIFPNPTSGNVTVALNHTSQTSIEGTVSVFDFSGKQIISQSIYSETELNLNSLPAGVYLVKVTSGAEAFAQKVVKH